MCLSFYLHASDEITIDLLFKKQKGLRGITNIEFISSSSFRSFSSYPTITSYDDGTAIEQTKKLSLRETLLYAYSSKVDVVFSFSGYYQKRDVIEDSIKTKDDKELENIWFGIKYEFDKKLYDFKQSLTAQVALYEKNHYQKDTKTTNFKSFNLRYTATSYLDPVVLTLSLESIQNRSKTFKDKRVDFPDIYSFGLDANIILNPKLSLSLNFVESYQTQMKEDGKKVNPSTILSQVGFGFTYNIDSKNAFILSSSTGTSASSPDSRLSVSLWHKY